MFWLKQNKKTFLILFFLILISIPSIFSLFHPGFFQSDDGEWMIIRFSAFHQALRDGQFPIRFLGRLNFGYGYTVANFLYPGFMYLSEPIKLLGFGFVNTIKIVLGLSMIGSAIFSYLWLGKVFVTRGFNLPAFIGSLFYLYTPYHLYDLYKRGSVGEVLALAVLPFIFWQIDRKSIFWSSIGIGFLILSHNTLAFLFIPLIILYLIFRNPKKYIMLNTLYMILFGLGLSAFFWMPSIFELSLTGFSQAQISDFQQYFAPIELIGISSILILSVSSIFLFNIFKVGPLNKVQTFRKVEPFGKVFILMIIISFLSIFFSSKPSLFLWNYIPSSFIQFPFRILSYLPFSLSFLTAFMIFNTKKKAQMFFAFIFIAFLFFSVYQYLKPPEFFDKGDSFYSTNEGTTNVKDEYMPKWVKVKPIQHFQDKLLPIEEEGKVADINVEGLTYSSKQISFNTSSQNDVKLKINTIYYPGWQAFIDGNKTDVQYKNNYGVINLQIPKGEHKVQLTFSETPLRLTADLISLASLALLVFLSIRKSSILSYPVPTISCQSGSPSR